LRRSPLGARPPLKAGRLAARAGVEPPGHQRARRGETTLGKAVLGVGFESKELLGGLNVLGRDESNRSGRMARAPLGEHVRDLGPAVIFIDPCLSG
jgi:hypothetical protein